MCIVAACILCACVLYVRKREPIYRKNIFFRETRVVFVVGIDAGLYRQYNISIVVVGVAVAVDFPLDFSQIH